MILWGISGIIIESQDIVNTPDEKWIPEDKLLSSPLFRLFISIFVGVIAIFLFNKNWGVFQMKRMSL